MNKRISRFNQRFWKILGITIIKVLLFLLVALVLVHIVLGRSALGELLFLVAPIIATGWGIKNVSDKLRIPPPLEH